MTRSSPRASDPGFDSEKGTRWPEAIARAHGLEVVSLTPAFHAASLANPEPWWFKNGKFFGHWNANGHAVAARAMFDYFRANPEGLAGERSLPRSPSHD